MDLEKIKNLESFLESMTRKNPYPYSSEYSVVIATQSVNAINQDNKTSVLQGSKIWYKEFDGVRMETIERIIEGLLIEKKHKVSTMLIYNILLLFTYHPDRNKGQVTALREILNLIVSVSVCQYYVLPSSDDSNINPIIFGDFTFSNLDRNQFKYRCEKAKSDFYDLYGEKHIGKIAIQRNPFTSNIINWHQFVSIYKGRLASSMTQDILLYFETLSDIYFTEFWDKFLNDQHIYIAFGLGYIDERFLQKIILSQKISIFLDIIADGAKKGYVVPSQNRTMTTEIYHELGKNFEDHFLALKKKYNISSFPQLPIHQTIKTYIEFNSKAYRYLNDERIDEGFLHFVISLDLLFLDKISISQSISNRVALLTYNKFKKNLKDHKGIISKIYDSRSKYVHRGISVPRYQLEDLKKICLEVLYCLLRAQLNKRYHDDDAIEKWKKDIDFVVSAMEAEKQINDIELINIGVDVIK